MVRYRSAIVVLAAAVTALASLTSLVLASPKALPMQSSQTLTIGVIGSSDGPTAQGVSLAVERISASGPITGPGGATYTLAVMAVDAKTADDVANVVTQLKGSNAVAIFGPDDDGLAAKSIDTLTGAGVPVFTAATSTAVKTGGSIFRTRAADNWQAAALAEVLVTDLGKAQFGIYQGNPDAAAAVGEMVTALTQRGKTPAQPVIQGGGAISDSAKALMDGQPDAVIGFGDPAQLAELYRALRGSGFAGVFATPHTDDPTFIRAIPDKLRGSIYGVTTWPYSWEAADSVAFTRDYVTTFGQVPTALSTAAYDAAVALIISVRGVGTAPDAIRDKLLALPKVASLQGTFNPKLGNGALAANSFVIVTGRYGAPKVVARFDETGRLRLTIALPTATPKPTLTPSATPEGVVATAKGTVNIRIGPGSVYPVIGQLKRNEQIPLIGASADLQWYVVNYRQQQGWISASLVSVFGDLRTLPVIAPPPTPIPTPTPLPTPTPTPVPYADLIMLSAVFSPAVPQPGMPFTLSVVVKNQGNADAGQFAVATSFQPGNVYTAAIVPGLPAGQQTTVNLTATVGGTTVSTIAVVLDLNNQVDEGPNGKANNKPEITYRIDRPRIANGSIQVPPSSSVDLQGGTTDISYDGTKLVPIHSAVLGALPGIQMTQVHYDYLGPSRINNTTGIAKADLVQGLVIGIYTAEGKRGAMRVAGYSGSTLLLEFFIYDS
jgi:ABC-type branched-subunit amino acid transport system substrate-binding protein